MSRPIVDEAEAELSEDCLQVQKPRCVVLAIVAMIAATLARAHAPIQRAPATPNKQDVAKLLSSPDLRATRLACSSWALALGACGHLRLHTGGLPFFPNQRWVEFETGKG